jgi:basic membrane protein A
VGPVGDAGWTWAHDQGRQAAAAATGVETAFVETVPEGTADFGNFVRQFIDDGFNVIVGTSFGYMDDMLALADEYPDVVFEHVSGYKANDTNFGNTFGRMYEPRYLSGMVAGSATTSNQIGYVAAFPIPEVIRGINAFTLGVREVNPDATVEVAWTSTWFDPVVEGDSAQALLDKGVDVIAMHQDSTAAGEKAEAAGARWVSYNSDMSAFAPNAYLTAPVWNWGPRYTEIIEAAAAGTYVPGYYWGSMADGLVDLAPIADDVDADVVAAVAARKAEIIAGTFHVFSGPINDQAGNVMVAAGATMEDGDMLGMGLFVEGVIGATGMEPDDFWPQPVFGGTLRVSLEAETDGLNPTVNRFAASAYQMAAAVFDPLAAWDENGMAVPYLAESITGSDDLMTWDVTLRPGIMFHDGTPVTSEAILLAFQRQLADPLIRLALVPMFPDDDPDTEEYELAEIIDELTVRFHMKRATAHFASYLTGQLGHVVSPTWLRAAIEDGTLNQAPVGSGPFRFDSRDQDQMTRFVRNDNYWNGDVYLDAVEFYVYTDSEIAADAMAVGDIDVLGTTNVDAILALREIDGLTLIEDDSGEEGFGILNTSKAPFDDIRARKALTYATARQDYLDFIGQGILRPADTWFGPGHPYHNPDVVQEADSPDLATPLVDEYCAELPDNCTDGRINMEFQFSGPSVIQERVYDILSEGWSDHFNITKEMLLQDDHITQVAFGLYDWVTWRQMGVQDPDVDALWLLCDAIGGLSLNWPRYCDPARDDLLYAQRASSDEAERAEIWKEVVAMVNQDYTYILFNHTLWSSAFSSRVQNICGPTSPDGVTLMCTVNGGNGVGYLWIEE